MRIVVDVTPLSLPRTGIGNYTLGMLGGLVEAAAGEHEIVAFSVSGPRRARRIREVLAGLDVERRLFVVPPSSHTWRTAWSRLGFPKVERLAGRLDVFHFSDWMYPSQRSGLRTTTVYDLSPLHHPEWVAPLTRRMHGRKYANAARTCDLVFAISRFTADDVSETLGVPRDRIPVAYPGAEVFASPSLFEGFGIPVIDAMASGTPVVASSHPSLDEAASEAAVRADPQRPDELAAAIERGIAERESLVPRGLEHARRFT